MTKVIVEPALRAKLRNLAEPLELCDEAGHLLGRFTPAAWEPPHLDEAELQRRAEEPEFSTAEVLAHLEKL
jgi:hypothetical protein